MTIAEMNRYLVSFGGEYKRTAHPVLGFWPELGQDAVLEVWAYDKNEAREATFGMIDKHWCAIYGPTDPPGWEVLNLGLLADAVNDPKPTCWTVGVQMTLNADGTLELHLEDATGDLAAEEAPPDLVRDLDERLEFWSPTVGWGKRVN